MIAFGNANSRFVGNISLPYTYVCEVLLRTMQMFETLHVVVNSVDLSRDPLRGEFLRYDKEKKRKTIASLCGTTRKKTCARFEEICLVRVCTYSIERYSAVC